MLEKPEIWKYLPFLRKTGYPDSMTPKTASGFSRSGGGFAANSAKRNGA